MGNKMKKWYYRLITKGYKTQIMIRGKLVDVKDISDKEKWNVPHLSKIKYVYAPNDEDVARFMIEEELTERKWTGFTMMVEMNK